MFDSVRPGERIWFDDGKIGGIVRAVSADQIRAEISDAAMGERAECVMLNKGPHIVDAIRVLDNILQRMQAHQTKKRSMLRRLHWWNKSKAAVKP